MPVPIDSGLDEMRAGDFQGKPIEAYWSWTDHHTGSERTPRGESGDDALLRFAHALRRLLSRTESVTLLIVHEASALPYLFYEYAIERAAAGLEASVRPDLA